MVSLFRFSETRMPLGYHIRVPLLCSLTMRQPTEPRVASGHGERMGTFPRGPRKRQTQQINNPHSSCVQASIRPLRKVRASPVFSLPKVSKNSSATPFKKPPKTGDQRVPACDLCHLSLSLRSPQRGKVSCFGFFTIRRAQLQ